MTVEERIEAADRRKVDGNELFKEGKIAEAMQQYEMVTHYPPFTTFAAENTMIVFQCLNLKFLYHGEKLKERKKERKKGNKEQKERLPMVLVSCV
jgi:hypothetical protein